LQKIARVEGDLWLFEFGSLFFGTRLKFGMNLIRRNEFYEIFGGRSVLRENYEKKGKFEYVGFWRHFRNLEKSLNLVIFEEVWN
jgi:hypothetical protein